MVTNVKPISFDDLFLGEDNEQYHEPTQADLDAELIGYLTCCGSCAHFTHFMAEAGFCDIAKDNCLCSNPKAMIDIWDDKCEKWVIDPRIVEDIMRSVSGYTCPYCELVSDLRPLARTETEFVERHGDMCYVWDELHKCNRCSNLYILENGT